MFIRVFLFFQWEEFMKLGEDVPDSDLKDRQATQAPNTCCSLIYTVSTCIYIFLKLLKYYL